MSFKAIITADINNFQRNLDKAKQGSRDFEQAVDKNLSGIDRNFGGFMTKIGGLVAGAFAVEKLIAFGTELAKIGMQAQGIEIAFYRMADDNRMKELQRATAGTVDELSLMKRAVMAQNFGIPIENLGVLLEFASKRAQDTGENIDYLVNSIVMGIGRKSAMILDNLGITTTQLAEKLKSAGGEAASVADYAAAVGAIAAESLEESGSIIENSGVKAQRAKADWQNLKTELGLVIAESELLGKSFDAIGRQIRLLDSNAERFGSVWRLIFGGKITRDFNREVAALGEELAEFTKEIDKTAAVKEKDNNIDEKKITTIKDLQDKIKGLKDGILLMDITKKAEIQSTLKEIQVNEELIKSLTTLSQVRTLVSAGSPINTRGETPTIASPFIPAELELDKLNSWKDSQIGKYREMMIQAQEEIDILNQDVNMAIADSFSSGLEAAFAGQNIEGILGAFLQPIANFLQQEGAMLIAHGLAIEVFKKSLQSLNGIAAIAAGTAMIATAAVFKGFVGGGARKFSGGASSYGGGYVSNNIASSGLDSGAFSEVQFKISGSDLIGVLNRQQLKQIRL